MSSKQYQITSFFQNKRQKTNTDVVDISNNSVNSDPDSLNIPCIALVDHAENVIENENKAKEKCNLLCCMSDTRYIPDEQSNLKSSSDKRSCQLGWFTKYNWLSYCKVIKQHLLILSPKLLLKGLFIIFSFLLE